MKTLNLLAALLLTGSLAVQAQILPQEMTISSQQYVPTHGYILKGISNPDPDAVKLLKEVLPLAQTGKALPLEIKKIKAKIPEMGRSGAYTLDITRKGITIEIADDRSSCARPNTTAPGPLPTISMSWANNSTLPCRLCGQATVSSTTSPSKVSNG